jgi:SAM-dependent methyltransferase
LSFSRRAEGFEATTPWLRREHLTREAVAMVAHRRSIGAVLDIGGGTGALARRFIGRRSVTRVVVLDPSSAMIDLVPEGIERWPLAIEACPETRAFDTVLARQVLHYVPDLSNALQVMRQQLRPNSLTYVGQLLSPTEESARWLQSVAEAISRDRRRIFTWASLVAAMTSAGYRLREAKVSPYWESLQSWIVRSGSTNQASELLEAARAAMTPGVAKAFDVRGDDLVMRSYWVNALYS